MKHGVLHWTRKNYVTVCVMALSIASSQAQAINLLTFGRACLSQEKELNLERRAIELSELQRLTEQQRKSGNRIPKSEYDQALEDLKKNLDDCKENSANSGYCHQVRIRYNELKYQANKAQEDSFKEWDYSPLVGADPLYEREAYQDKYDRFEALCRDSDAHYDLINNPDVYKAICSAASSKHSVTCSFTN